MNYILNAYAIQDIGHRSNQEDSFYPPFFEKCHYDATKRECSYYDGAPRTDDRFFIVCDGMGGHERGEVASRSVITSMSNYLKQHTSIEGPFDDDIVRQAVSKALDDLAAQDDPREKRKMGTTMALLKFHAGGATIGHIGDTRVYQYRPADKGHPAQILFRTEDHIMVNELVRHGQISSDDAICVNNKHILSRSMTSDKNYRPEVEISHVTNIRPNDIFMICSDGIYENLDDDELCHLLCDPNYGDQERIQCLLQQTLDNRDNHTAIIIRVQNIFNVSGEESKEETLPVGSIINSPNYSYHIEKVLGQGAFGITYLASTSVAMQGDLGTIHSEIKMAVKEFFMHNDTKRLGAEIVPDSMTERVKQYATKFRNEAAKLAMLSHPHIVKVLEVFEANNTIYYSMEYLPDGTLNDYAAKKKGLPEQEAIRYIRQIGSALLYLHTNKILHLDVKPANIMRNESTDTLKLIDFGLSKQYEENGDAMSSGFLGCGTSGYAPLEQADGSVEKEFSPQIDVYALGATYYKLLTDQVPDNAIDVLNKGLRTLPLVKKNVSQQSIDAIRAAMEPTVAKRLKNVQEFLDRLPRVDDESIFPEKTHKDFLSRICFWRKG